MNNVHTIRARPKNQLVKRVYLACPSLANRFTTAKNGRLFHFSLGVTTTLGHRLSTWAPLRRQQSCFPCCLQAVGLERSKKKRRGGLRIRFGKTRLGLVGYLQDKTVPFQFPSVQWGECERNLWIPFYSPAFPLYTPHLMQWWYVALKFEIVSSRKRKDWMCFIWEGQARVALVRESRQIYLYIRMCVLCMLTSARHLCKYWWSLLSIALTIVTIRQVFVASDGNRLGVGLWNSSSLQRGNCFFLSWRAF